MQHAQGNPELCELHTFRGNINVIKEFVGLTTEQHDDIPCKIILASVDENTNEYREVPEPYRKNTVINACYCLPIKVTEKFLMLLTGMSVLGFVSF